MYFQQLDRFTLARSTLNSWSKFRIRKDISRLGFVPISNFYYVTYSSKRNNINGKTILWKQETIGQYKEKNTINISVKNRKSPLAEKFIFVGAIVAILVMLLFIYYIFSEAMPVFSREGLGFITGTKWNYGTDQYGIL